LFSEGVMALNGLFRRHAAPAPPLTPALALCERLRHLDVSHNVLAELPDALAGVSPAPEGKRRGRKPGSKNKPKVAPTGGASAGDESSGDESSGDEPSGDETSGDEPSGEPRSAPAKTAAAGVPPLRNGPPRVVASPPDGPSPRPPSPA
jgi:hypothetical protein